MRALLILLPVLLAHASAKPMCVGYAEFPELDKDCRGRLKEDLCLKGYAMRSQNVSASCIWHMLTKSKTVDRQLVYNRAGGVVLSGLNYQGTVCATSVRVTLPTSAKGRWGAYIRLMGGPQNTSVYSYSTKPTIGSTIAGCTVGKGFPATCKVNLTAPNGYAQHPEFRQNSVVFEFFTSDSNLTKQWRQYGRLTSKQTLQFKLELQGYRCRTPSTTPPQTPIVRDQVLFGPTSFLLNQDPKHYYFLSYRSYRLTNVTGASWSVSIPRTLSATSKRTKLASMLMREVDYINWSGKICNKTCLPPTDLALPGTLCFDYQCQRSATGLGSKAGAYRLLVSYPEISTFDWSGSYADSRPVNSIYSKQLVKVEIWPQSWDLEALPQATVAAPVAAVNSTTTAATADPGILQPRNVGLPLAENKPITQEDTSVEGVVVSGDGPHDGQLPPVAI